MTAPADDLTAVLPQDLPRCDGRTLLSPTRSLPDSGQRTAACEMLVVRYQPPVRSCVRAALRQR
jgi:hypothetical protein